MMKALLGMVTAALVVVPAPVVWGHGSWKVGAMSALVTAALVGGLTLGRARLRVRPADGRVSG
jgi:hypothetical protein